MRHFLCGFKFVAIYITYWTNLPRQKVNNFVEIHTIVSICILQASHCFLEIENLWRINKAMTFLARVLQVKITPIHVNFKTIIWTIKANHDLGYAQKITDVMSGPEIWNRTLPYGLVIMLRAESTSSLVFEYWYETLRRS